MKRPSEQSGRRQRPRTAERLSVRFVVETEYVDRMPHIVTVRPIGLNATPEVVEFSRLIARRLVQTTHAEVRRYLGRRRRSAIDFVLNGILFFHRRHKYY